VLQISCSFQYRLVSKKFKEKEMTELGSNLDPGFEFDQNVWD
jgi:hypothetical protein